MPKQPRPAMTNHAKLKLRLTRAKKALREAMAVEREAYERMVRAWVKVSAAQKDLEEYEKKKGKK